MSYETTFEYGLSLESMEKGFFYADIDLEVTVSGKPERTYCDNQGNLTEWEWSVTGLSVHSTNGKELKYVEVERTSQLWDFILNEIDENEHFVEKIIESLNNEVAE